MTAGAMHRKGISLIEVLVVIAIVAVLLGLLLPAVQKVRDAASAAGCRNHLKQLGLAALNYEAALGTLPPALSSYADGARFIAHGWGAYLLPYLEQPALAGRYDFAKSFNDTGTNQGVILASIREMTCPANYYPRVEYSLPVAIGSYLPGRSDSTDSYRAAAADYTPIRAVTRKAYDPQQLDIPESDPRHPVDRVGMLTASFAGFGVMEKPCRVTDVADGMAATFLFVESAGRPNLIVAGGADAPGSGISPGAGWGEPDGGMFGLLGASADGTTAAGKCFVNCRNARGLYGFHPAGANAVFGDGSVRLVPAAADPYTVAAAATARGGETPGDF